MTTFVQSMFILKDLRALYLQDIGYWTRNMSLVYAELELAAMGSPHRHA